MVWLVVIRLGSVVDAATPDPAAGVPQDISP